MNERPLLLERKCPFCTSKDSVKTISDVILKLHIFKKFRSARERHNIVWFWSYTKVPLLANAPPLSKCFRGLWCLWKCGMIKYTASSYVGAILLAWTEKVHNPRSSTNVSNQYLRTDNSQPFLQFDILSTLISTDLIGISLDIRPRLHYTGLLFIPD